MTDDDLRARLRAAADEIEQAHPARRRVHSRPLASNGRRAMVAAQLAALVAAIVFVANQSGPVAQTGDVDALISPLPSLTDGSVPLPVPTVSPTPKPTLIPEPSPSPTPEPTTTPTPRPTPSKWPARGACGEPPPGQAPEGIRLTLEVTPAPTGATLRLTMKNEGVLPVKNMHGNPEADFLITGPTGEVWLWSIGKVFTQELRNDQYAPGEERSKVEAWDRTGNCTGAPPGVQPAGTYNAVGLWMSYNERYVQSWRSNVVSFTLP